jgi:hypothetical protein
MRFNPRHLALIAVTAGALVPATAGARPLPPDPYTPPDAHDVGITHGSGNGCGIDYSRNSVSGTYCAPTTSSPSSSPSSITTHPTQVPSAAPIVVVKHDDGFAWGEAGIGAGGALVLGLVAGGSVVAIRRRHASSTLGQQRTPATS